MIELFWACLKSNIFGGVGCVRHPCHIGKIRIHTKSRIQVADGKNSVYETHNINEMTKQFRDSWQSWGGYLTSTSLISARKKVVRTPGLY